MTEIDLLSRAHALFEGQAMRTAPDVVGPGPRAGWLFE